MNKVKRIIVSCVGLALLSGCSTTTSQRVGVAAETYITVTNSMTTLAKSGQLSLSTAEEFETYRKPAKEYLDIAIDDLLDGDNDESRAGNAIDILIPILDSMIEANREAHGND